MPPKSACLSLSQTALQTLNQIGQLKPQLGAATNGSHTCSWLGTAATFDGGADISGHAIAVVGNRFCICTISAPTWHKVNEQLASLIRMLDSPSKGKQLIALAAVDGVLISAGLTWDDLADALERSKLDVDRESIK